jgi:non-ribosomal peptide synthetase component F
LAVVASGRALSFGELVARAWFVAGELSAAGVVRGDRVAVVVDKSVEQVVAVLGVQLAGAAYVPVDPSMPVERQRFVVGHAGCAAVLTGCGVDRVDGWGPPVVVVDADDDAAVAEGPLPVVGQVEPSDVASIRRGRRVCPRVSRCRIGRL